MSMISRAEFEQFTVEADGDRHEQTFWKLLQEDFPAYQVFWRQYIVPLTNRVDPSISREDNRWIRIRPSVSDEYLRMVMGHYSVFHFLGRATTRMQAPENVEYAEDVLYLLDSAADNLAHFLKALIKIAKDADTQFAFRPDQFPKTLDPVFQEISTYRDTLLHNPVLGRRTDLSVEFLPRYKVLQHVKVLWRNAESLPDSDFVESKDLLTRLCAEMKESLQKIWVDILKTLNESRVWEKMAENTGLAVFLPIRTQPLTATTSQPVATSGQIIRGAHNASSPEF